MSTIDSATYQEWCQWVLSRRGHVLTLEYSDPNRSIEYGYVGHGVRFNVADLPAPPLWERLQSLIPSAQHPHKPLAVRLAGTLRTEVTDIGAKYIELDAPTDAERAADRLLDLEAELTGVPEHVYKRRLNRPRPAGDPTRESKQEVTP